MAAISPRLADLNAGEWNEHSRFKGIAMKGMLTPDDNPLASVNAVRVPSGSEIGRHRHPTQYETVYVITGESILTLGESEVPFGAGQVVAIPPALEHGLRNVGTTPVELLTFFTPPLT